MRSLLRVPVPARDRPEAGPASSVLTAEPAQALLSRTGEQRDRFPPPLALPIFSPVDVDAPRSAEQRVQWVYGARSASESRRRYDQWAPQYEQDLVDTYGYRLPDTIAEDFARWVMPHATVLDAGVGTGLVGACLADLGFRDLVGLDNSPAMLAESARKGVYRALHEMTLGQPSGFESAIFDAVISAGTFTEGHAPASGLREQWSVCKTTCRALLAIDAPRCVPPPRRTLPVRLRRRALRGTPLSSHTATPFHRQTTSPGHPPGRPRGCRDPARHNRVARVCRDH